MKLIKNNGQLLVNIRTVENYLAEGTAEEIHAIRELIRRGKCFLAYEVNKEMRFAPSRFLGYINNNLERHDAAKARHDVDGRDTNPAITKVLVQKLFTTGNLEKKYLAYCKSLGLIPADVKNRKFWSLSLEKDFEENEIIEGGFPEGKVVERIHRTRERNKKVIVAAKQNFKKKHGKLFCQVCKFDFEKKYGKPGKDFIDGHHTVPVSEMKEGHVTKPEEIALLCSNCHRMIHKRRPWFTMKNISKLIKQ